MGYYILDEDITDDEYLAHYGVKRKSGRYPWGSGEDPYQHEGWNLDKYNEYKNEGKSEKEIAEKMGLTVGQLRIEKNIERDNARRIRVATAKQLREDGKTLQEIADIMGLNNDSSVRALLNSNAEARMEVARNTAEFLKKHCDEKGMIDVGVGVNREINVTREKMDEALYLLQREGYEVWGGGVPQATNPGKQTNLKVLCPPGTPHSAIFNHENIHTINDYISSDNGKTFDKKNVDPVSIDSSRIMVRYAEDGGAERDGTIEIRRGVPDLDLRDNHYAQVRIMTDDSHYMKGMALYSDDMPDGIDIIYNVHYKKGTPMLGEKGNTVLKPVKKDENGPFGTPPKVGIYDPDADEPLTSYGQSYYIDKDGNKKLSAINILRAEGDWNQWNDKTVSPQMLAKQSKELAKRQLNIEAANKQAEYDDIISLTNPTVKKVLLQSFANDCDAAAIHLEAAALPRQKFQVLLPVPSLKETEVYAPGYKNGEKVALIRYPHGGTFEIPILTVNNKHEDSKKMLGTEVSDCVGINSKVAARLSGADFDGDAVMVIPCNNSRSSIRINSSPTLQGLEGFDPQVEYATHYKGGKLYNDYGIEIKPMKNTQTEMGKVSNLITDMTILGATSDELARAVRHSMVVIDAEKHGLDYKQSEIDNGIAALKKKYQGYYDENGKYHGGASTLISRANAQASVEKRQGNARINKETGELEWKVSDKSRYIDAKTGQEVIRTQKSVQMAETKDAYTLSTGTPMEDLYAGYANKMKTLANEARKTMISTPGIKYNASANKTYKAEVDDLLHQLNEVEKNKPRERKAQTYTNSVVEAAKKRHLEETGTKMKNADIKKLSQTTLTNAREEYGAHRTTIKINDRQWEAIQAGAITNNTLMKIINSIDIDELRERSTPNNGKDLSNIKISQIKSLKSNGYTVAEIADRLGISASTVSKYSTGN